MKLKKEEEEEEFELDPGCCGADPITKQGQRMQRFQMMLLPLIPAAILVFQCFFGLIVTMGQRSHVLRFEEELKYDEAVAILANQIHKEWRSVNWYLLTGSEEHNHPQLEVIFNQTMDGIHKLEMSIATNQYLVISEDIRQEDELIRQKLELFHVEIFNTSMDVDMTREFYEDILKRLQNEVFTLDRMQEEDDPHWEKLVAMQTLLTTRNNLGVEHILGQKYFYGDEFTIRDFNTFVGETYVTNQGIELAKDHYSRIETLYITNYIYNFELHDAISAMEHQILRFNVDEKRTKDIDMAIKWRDNVTSYAEILEEMEIIVAKDIQKQVDHEKQSIAAKISASIVSVVFVVVGVPMILAFIYRTGKTIQRQVAVLMVTDRELRKEKKKSDTILYQMLPKSVALQLKLNQRVAPEVYNCVTVFFSDIVGFTSLSAKSSPMQVVDFLNDLYFSFDSIIDRHDVYKVETIGDAYMIASGLPQRNGKNHAGQIATMSLELVQCVESFVIPHLPAEQIKMRVGLHSGPVVAGVVGTKMPRYCLFGETVDVASLMESSGVEMKIQLSMDCRTILEEVGGYTMETRGTFVWKGKEIESSFLLERVGSVFSSRVTSRKGSRKPEIPLLNFTTALEDEKEV